MRHLFTWHIQITASLHHSYVNATKHCFTRKLSVTHWTWTNTSLNGWTQNKSFRDPVLKILNKTNLYCSCILWFRCTVNVNCYRGSGCHCVFNSSIAVASGTLEKLCAHSVREEKSNNRFPLSAETVGGDVLSMLHLWPRFIILCIFMLMPHVSSSYNEVKNVCTHAQQTHKSHVMFRLSLCLLRFVQLSSRATLRQK